jgi:hypothetical protein
LGFFLFVSGSLESSDILGMIPGSVWLHLNRLYKEAYSVIIYIIDSIIFSHHVKYSFRQMTTIKQREDGIKMRDKVK